MGEVTTLKRSQKNNNDSESPSSSGSRSRSANHSTAPDAANAQPGTNVPAIYLSRLPNQSFSEPAVFSMLMPTENTEYPQFSQLDAATTTALDSGVEDTTASANEEETSAAEDTVNMANIDGATESSATSEEISDSQAATESDTASSIAVGGTPATGETPVNAGQSKQQDDAEQAPAEPQITAVLGGNNRRQQQSEELPKIPPYELPPLNIIRTPIIASPPKQAILRRDEIIKKTGSPPELHHAQIRQVLQRLTDTAKTSQRSVVRRINFLAKDTRSSFSDMAKEISHSIHSAIGSIKKGIQTAKVEIGTVVTAIEAHFEQNQSLLGEQLRNSQSTNSENVRGMLLEGSNDLRAAEEAIQMEFLPYLDDAKAKMRKIGTDGVIEQVTPPPTVSPPGSANSSGSSDTTSASSDLMCVEPSTTTEPEKNMDDVALEIEEHCRSLSENPIGLYTAYRAHPVATRLFDRTQTDLTASFGRQADGLEGYRNSFIFSALRLVTPTITDVETDQREQIEENDGFHRGATDDVVLATQYDLEVILNKQIDVERFLDEEVGEKLIKNFYEMENKAVTSFIHQGDTSARILENTATPMSMAYAEIIARVAAMLPSEQFLEAEKYIPSILSAEKSAMEMPDLQMEKLHERSGSIIDNANKGKEKKIESIGQSLDKGLQSINDVVTQTQFDMDNFTYQSTGVMREGGQESIRGAQDYALRTAEDLLKTKGQAEGQLNHLIAGYVGSFNTTLQQAGGGYFKSVNSFRDNLFKDGSGVFDTIAAENSTKLSQKSQVLNENLTHADPDVVTGLVIGSIATGGLALGATVGYLVYSDADESDVFTALGDLDWPGQPALEEYFENEGGYRNLRTRINESLDADDAVDALGLLSPSAEIRGNARVNAADRSLSYTDFGISDEARQALLAGMSDAERAAADQTQLEHVAQEIRDSWTLTDTEIRIESGYIRGNLDEVIAAKMQDSTRRARINGDSNIQQSVQSIDQITRTEMARTQSATYIEGAEIQALIDDSMQEFAANRPGEKREADNIGLTEARQSFVDYATADRYVGGGHREGPPPRPVPVDQFVKDYVEEVVNNGFYIPTESTDDRADAVEPNPNARAAAQAYQIHRAEGSTFGPSETNTTQFNAAFANPSYQRLQVEIEEIRERGETVPPEKIKQLADARERHEQQMARVAARLVRPDEQGPAPGQATEWMAQRAAQAMAGEDAVDAGTSINQSNAEPGMARFATEVIRNGRASIAAGVEVATDGAGTNEDLLRSIYGHRRQSEIAAAETEWRERYGEDLNEHLGIKDREWDALDYATLAIFPVAGLGLLMFRGGETSGDLAMELELLAEGEPENDEDRLKVAMMRAEQQQGRGTGWLGQLTMSGTAENQNMNIRRKALAQMLLDEAQRRQGSGAAQDLPGLSNVFLPDGRVNPAIAALVFALAPAGATGGPPSSEFQGNRGQLLESIHGLELSGQRYQSEQARQESLMLAGITVLAIAATVILMAFGVGFVLAGMLVALGSGILTMAVKQGMRGERYGWEEAATDAAMTAIQVAAAGAGGALSGGFGTAGKLGAVVNGFKNLGPLAGPMAREALVGAVSSAAQMALQDGTFDDGPGKALERLLGAGIKGGAIGAVSAGLSEGATNKLGRGLAEGLDGNSISNMATIGARMGPNGRAMFTEVVSEGIGSVAGEGVGILMEVSKGEFRGGLDDALRRLGKKGLEDMVSAAGRTAATSRNKRIYGDFLADARTKDNLTDADIRVLRMAGAAAGEPFESLGAVRRRVTDGQRALASLPPELRDILSTLDADNLNGIINMLRGAELGDTSIERQELLQNISEKAPQIDTVTLTQKLEIFSARRQTTLNQQKQATATEQQAATRTQLLKGFDEDLAGSLARVPVDGLDKLTSEDLQSVAEMIRSGHFDQTIADAALARALEANPDLDAFSLIMNLQTAVDISQRAQQLDRDIKQQVYNDVMANLDEEGRQVFAGLPADDIARIKMLFDSQTELSAHDQKVLFDSAQRNNPELTAMQFDRLLDAGMARAAEQQKNIRESAREQRKQHMLNIPEQQRDLLSVLPDDALIDLRLRQQQGEPLSADNIHRLLQRALAETPNVDLRSLEQALHIAVAYKPEIASVHSEAMLRQEFTAAISKEQRGEFADVPILIMSDGEFEAFTRSQKGQAVTLIIDGRPVVLMRQSADPSVLREEGIHVLQSREPEWADRLNALDERKMADWDKLPLAEQLALYRNKVAIEIDAQQRLLGSLETDLADASKPRARVQLQARLEQAQAALHNLMNRAGEVESISGLHLKAIAVGQMDKPDWLEQPSRLFTKQRNDPESTGPPARNDQESESDTSLSSEDLTASAKRIQKEINNLDLDLDHDALMANLRSDEMADVASDIEPIINLLSIDKQKKLVVMAIMFREVGMTTQGFAVLLKSFNGLDQQQIADKLVTIFWKRKIGSNVEKAMNLATVLNSDLPELSKVKLMTRIFVGDAASGRNSLREDRINNTLGIINDFLRRNTSTLSADSLNTAMDLLGSNLTPNDLSKNIKTIEELQRAVDASEGDTELLDGIIHIATMVGQSVNMVKGMTKMVADLSVHPESADLILALKAYIQGAIEGDNGLSLLVSLQRMANTLKGGGQLDGSIIAALQSKETLGRVVANHTVDDSLKTPHEGFTAKSINEDNADATTTQKEINDQEFVEIWHAFLISKQKVSGQEGEFSVAESYKKFHEFLVSPDGFNLSHAQTMLVLRGIISKRVDNNKPLTIDGIRHDFKAHFKKDIMDWVLHGDASVRAADVRFDGNDLAQVQGSLDRLNTLTTHGLNVKDQGNFAESWYEAYKASRGEGIETQVVLREDENHMVGDERNDFNVPSTISDKRKPDFADQVPDAGTANSQDMLDSLALGDVKSHKGRLSKDDERKIRAYLRAVSHAVDAQNLQLGTRGAKARNGKGEIELPHQYQKMRLVFTNADGAIASSKMLGKLMNDYPSEFTVVFFNPHTGARIELNSGSLEDYKAKSPANTLKEVMQTLSKPPDTEVSVEVGS